MSELMVATDVQRAYECGMGLAEGAPTLLETWSCSSQITNVRTQHDVTRQFSADSCAVPRNSMLNLQRAHSRALPG